MHSNVQVISCTLLMSVVLTFSGCSSESSPRHVQIEAEDVQKGAIGPEHSGERTEEQKYPNSPSVSMGEGTPEAISSCLASESLKGAYAASAVWNPYYLRGDFDGNGMQDYAVFVRSIESEQYGIVICHAMTDEVVVLAAGNDFQMEESFSQNDFRIWDFWVVVDPSSVSDLATKSEGIFLGIFDSGNGIIYRKGKKYVWKGLAE